LSYWQNKLDGFETLKLPADYVRPAVKQYNGDTYELKFSKQLSENLRKVASAHGTTLQSVMLGAFSILFSKYSGQKDIIIGSPIANRHYHELENSIGFFVNTLVNRIRLEAKQTFGELIKTIHEDQIQAQLMQDLPFDRLVDEMKLARDPAKNSIFQVLLAVQSSGEIDPNSAFAKVFRPVAFEEGIEKFDISVIVDDSTEEIGGYISYATSLFKKETVARLAGHLQLLLEILLLSPSEDYPALNLLDEKTLLSITQEWNDTDKSFDTGKTTHRLITDLATKNPYKIALVHGDDTLTYQQLDEKSNQLARHICDQYRQIAGKEIAPDMPVAIYLERGIDAVIAMIAVHKAGTAYVPVDPEYPNSRTDFILSDTGAALILTDFLSVEKLSDQWKNRSVKIDNEAIYLGDISSLSIQGNTTDLAYIIYTSGTTGKPKGVMVDHANLLNLVYNQKEYLSVNAQSVVLQYASLVFDASVWEIFSTLSFGGELHIIESASRNDPHLLAAYLTDHNITIATLPPALIGSIPQQEFPSLKTLVFAGEACTQSLMDQWSEGRTLYNAYGPTEGTVCTTMHRYEKGDLNTNIGQPLYNQKVYVLDDQQQPVPVGVTGELCVAGDSVAKGYWKRPDLTDQKFTDNPLITDNAKYNRLYHTGDMVRWLADGSLQFIGRDDEQVKVRGHRIELGEVENTISSVEGIARACVLLKTREISGKADAFLTAYFVTDEASDLTAEDLKDSVSSILPAYMVPSGWVKMDEFSLTINGKIDKHALPEPDFSAQTTYVAAANEPERQACLIWQELLNIPQVGVTDGFFAIGGNSILAIQLSHRMSEQMNTDIR
ncbi:MAG: amino acid adenylation domain-containing protein, partial [Cyclobacteriaceae bacterium]